MTSMWMKRGNEPVYVGMDIGGTNLKAGLVSENGVLLSRVQETGNPSETPEEFASHLCALALRAARLGGAAPEEIQAVGMGFPGAVEGGTILYTANLPLKNVPLTALFQRSLDVPVFLGNDADCAALGEYWQGAGRNTRSLLVITLGTGIGAGLILDGKLYRGMGFAGEVGHMAVEKDGLPCECGRKGCWEVYASATGLKRMTRQSMDLYPDSLMWTLAKNGKPSGRTAFQAAQLGDEAARTVCAAYISYLVAGITNLVNILHPEVLAIGGGISNEREEALLGPVREIVERECYPRHGGILTRIVKAQLGNDAGILGAAALCKA